MYQLLLRIIIKSTTQTCIEKERRVQKEKQNWRRGAAWRAATVVKAHMEAAAMAKCAG